MSNNKTGSDQEVVEVEAYGKENTEPPPAKSYKIRIDRDHYTVAQRTITGRELLALAKKPVERWRIHQKRHGGQMLEVGLDQSVDLGERGLERFVTMELAQTDGEHAAVLDTTVVSEPPPRRAFRLPEEDENYLDTLGLRWETVVEANVRWLLIHDHPIPEGFNHASATAAYRIDGGYPPGKLDMVYFFPALARKDGATIPNLSPLTLDGKSYQQWSRHYTWLEGIDTLATHHLRSKQWLLDELKR